MDSDERPAGQHFEIEFGWNTSPPKFQFPDSDRLDAMSQSPVHEVPPPPSMVRSSNANQESLGKYSNSLPGSSPPRPRLKVRKRKMASSPLKDLKQPKIDENLFENSDDDESPETIADCPIEISTTEIVDQAITVEDTNMHSLPLQTELINKAPIISSASLPAKKSSTLEKPSLETSSGQKKQPVRSISDAELAMSDMDDDSEDIFAETPVIYVPSFFSNRKVRRFIVQKVTAFSEKTAVFCSNAQQEPCTIESRGSWRDSIIQREDVSHSVSSKPSGSLVVDSNAAPEEQILVIINPDILIPCTTVAQAMSCERQVVLNSRVRTPSDSNENLVLGSIKHEFIQACFTAGVNGVGSFTPELMLHELRSACEASELDSRLVDSDVESAFTKLEPVIPEIRKWATQIWGKSSRGVRVEPGIKVRINRAVQIEEEIRSPYLGLVGKIDVSCEVSLFNDNNTVTNRLAACEIKTGKFTKNIAHRAQTALYTLSMAERHPNNTHPWSLLYYTETSETTAIALKHREIASLIQRRNAIAHDMWYIPGQELPIPISASDMSCKWCNRKDSCILYTATRDQGDTQNVGALKAVYDEAAESGKLTPRFLEFIKHWHELLDLEYETSNRLEYLKSRQWWLTEPEPLMLKLGKKLEQENPLASGHFYSLIPANAATLDQSVLDTSGHKGSAVLLSTRQHMAINCGVITSINEQEIQIVVREELPSFGKYRLDVDPWMRDAHSGLARFNLDNLMKSDRLRELVVDLVPPLWSSFSKKTIESTIERASNRVLPTQMTLTSGSNKSLTSASSPSASSSLSTPASSNHNQSHSNLNEDQAAALNKVLNTRDYALILGMPGTGKTTTIAAIVASLVERGKTVLVSAYTNSAVDTIVRKLLDAQQKCLRLVSSKFDIQSMPSEVASVAVPMSGSESSTRLVEFSSSPVVACTSHGTNNKIFSLRQFDYCILDEASQITSPYVSGPSQLAPRFVLVGDHYQSPPLVRNQQARKLGMDQSLFKILCEAHPEAVVSLTKQYRMCRDIMSLSSELVYDGRLVAGSEEVANQRLEVRSLSFINPKSPLYTALAPENSVVFWNTDHLGIQAYEKKHDDGSSNPGEAKIIVNLVTTLADIGLSMDDCAVISVYRHQLAELSKLLQPYVERGLEILTADQAQGRDKKCILVSLVKSNTTASSGELLKDWRRLNVAFTRAKQKLVIVGSKQTMQQADGVARFFNFIESKGWVHAASILS